VLFFFIPFLIGNIILSTPKDVAYRNFHVAFAAVPARPCDRLDNPAEVDPEKVGNAGTPADDWIDSSNDELFAVAKAQLAKRLRCSLQRHIIPVIAEAAPEVKKPIEYYLGLPGVKKTAIPTRLFRRRKGRRAGLN